MLGLPGCARSPRVNGFDWVLRRIVADLPVDDAALARMGVGGLLSEIPTRPQPRAKDSDDAGEAPAAPHAPRIAALVLAAGRSSRMGTINKLLITIDGKPMVRHAVDAVREAGLDPVIVVTGHERERVEAALRDAAVTFVHNPAYAEGLSSSLKAGLAARAERAPTGSWSGLATCRRWARPTSSASSSPSTRSRGGRSSFLCATASAAIPVLWAKRFIPEMLHEVAGDVGARHLIGAYPEAVVEVEMPSDGVLTDIDTPQALARLAGSARVEV